jgi:hypothetical protein
VLTEPRATDLGWRRALRSASDLHLGLMAADQEPGNLR